MNKLACKQSEKGRGVMRVNQLSERPNDHYKTGSSLLRNIPFFVRKKKKNFHLVVIWNFDKKLLVCVAKRFEPERRASNFHRGRKKTSSSFFCLFFLSFFCRFVLSLSVCMCAYVQRTLTPVGLLVGRVTRSFDDPHVVRMGQTRLDFFSFVFCLPLKTIYNI